MNNSKKVTVLPHLDTSHKRKSDGKSKFFIKVRIAGQVKLYDIQPELLMDKKYWVHEVDPETGAKKKRMRIQHANGNHNSKTLERLLAGKVSEMVNLIENLIKKGHTPSQVMLAQRWKGTDAKSLVEYMRWRIKEDSPGASKGTIRNWNAGLNCLEEYTPKVMLAAITPEWLLAYEDYLRNRKPVCHHKPILGEEKKNLRYGLASNTVATRLAILGKILKHAYRQDYIAKNPMDLFLADRGTRKRFAYKAPERNVLEGHEIERLHQAYLSKELITMFEEGSKRQRTKGQKYHNVLQQILASIYTGFRFGDICKFQDELEVSFTPERISLTMQKVKRKHSLKITNKLKDVLSLREENRLFSAPIYGSTHSNSMLREIMPLLGIDKYLSWHDLRRSFASYLQEMDVDIKKVSRLMGHSSVVTTEKYVKVRDQDLDKAMDVWDKETETSQDQQNDVVAALATLRKAYPNLDLPLNLADSPPTMKEEKEAVFRIVS